MAFLTIDARRLRRGVPTAFLSLLFLFPLLSFIACAPGQQRQSLL